MGIRKVRLDAEAEQVLREVAQATGLNVSEALTRGLLALKREIERTIASSPYEVYKHLAWELAACPEPHRRRCAAGCGRPFERSIADELRESLPVGSPFKTARR